MRKICIILILIIFFITSATIAAIFYNRKFDNSINLAIAYIINHTEPNGRFIYKTSLNDAKMDKVKYNALRHAGVLYSMYLYEQGMKNKTYKDTRYLASDYFIKRYIKQVKDDMYAVVSLASDKEVSFEVAKTGGSGLGLMALSNLYPEGKVDLKILEGLGNFLIFMQKPDGSFYSKYNISSSIKDDKFNSIYYPGEAALGLLYLNDVNPSEKWIKASKNALLYIAKSNAGKKDIQFNHWAASAIKKLIDTPENTLTQDEELVLRKFGQRLAKSVIFKQNLDRESEFYGSFADNVKLGSIGTIMEGLSALYYIVEDKNLKKRIKISLDAGNEFLSKYQVKEGELAGGIPNSALWVKERSFASSKVIRIDNVQHCLSAWVLAKRVK